MRQVRQGLSVHCPAALSAATGSHSLWRACVSSCYRLLLRSVPDRLWPQLRRSKFSDAPAMGVGQEMTSLGREMRVIPDSGADRVPKRELSSAELSELASQAPPKLIGSSSDPPTVLSQTQLLLLRRALPARYTLCDWNLLFSTDQHGCSLRTFYSRLECEGATILIVLDTQVGGTASEEGVGEWVGEWAGGRGEWRGAW